MSRMKAQNVYDRSVVAKRLRFLRGSMTQTEFAKKVGISRSALANYETGRTIPNRDTLIKIANAFEISNDFFTSGEVKDIAELATIFGFGPNSTDSLTEHEWAVVRVLRIRKTEVIKQVLDIILSDIEKDPGLKLADLMTIEEDLAYLFTVKADPNLYLRGVSRGNLEKVVEELARRLDDNN